MRVRLKGIHTVKKKLADGSIATYYYHRATRKRLSGEPGTAEFIASLSEAESSLTPYAGTDTFSSLVRTYTSSIEFDDLAPSTQAEKRRMLTAAEAEFGTMPIAALKDSRVKRDFLKWRQKIAKSSGKREADNRISAISAMLTWAVDGGEGDLETNHIKGAKRLYKANRAEIIWLPEHIEAFWATAPVEMRQAMMLALHTGQREGDLLRLSWSAYDGRFIRLRQSKTKRTSNRLVEIPCTKSLRQMLDAMPKVSTLILNTKAGRPFTKRYFIESWNDVMKNAGLESVRFPNIDEPVKLHFHDLRGTAVTLLSEARCTPQQIATITGHSLKGVHDILERYLARTRTLAVQAIENFESSPVTDFVNRLETADPGKRKGNRTNE